MLTKKLTIMKIIYDNEPMEGHNAILQSNYRCLNESVFYYVEYKDIKAKIKDEKENNYWLGNDIGIWRMKKLKQVTQLKNNSLY